jgi:hypothetical protein
VSAPHWRWPAAAVAIAGLVLIAYLVTLERCSAIGRQAASAPAEVVAGLERAARGFFRGDVTQRFLSSIPEVRTPGVANLELAVAETTETVQRVDERRAVWDLVDLGRTTVEIRVPVTWRYHVPLSGPWKATIEDSLMVVEAPALRPSLPPAIHTDRLERRVEADWLRFDGPQRLAELESQLTPLLSQRAADWRHVALAREPARRALEGAARAWLAAEGGSEEVRAIVVRFADEPGPVTIPALGSGDKH